MIYKDHADVSENPITHTTSPEITTTYTTTISTNTPLSTSIPVITTPPLTATPTITLPEGNDLSFQTITRQNHDNYYGDNPQILIIPTSQITPDEIKRWIIDTEVLKVNSVDYSKYFLVIGFNGFLGYYRTDFEIKNVIQNKNLIYVMAHFSTISNTVAPMYSSQSHIVIVDKENMSQYGDLIFKLIDESGQEKASTTQNISK